jgi:transposase InsO family protein
MCVKRFKVSERRACQSLGVHRSTIRYELTQQPEEQRLIAELHRLSREDPFYGYKKVWALLRRDGWHVNRKRVERLWRLEGLTIPPNHGMPGGQEMNVEDARLLPRDEQLALLQAACYREINSDSIDVVQVGSVDHATFENVVTLFTDWSDPASTLRDVVRAAIRGSDGPTASVRFEPWDEDDRYW